jgi:hypothetical protein
MDSVNKIKISLDIFIKYYNDNKDNKDFDYTTLNKVNLNTLNHILKNLEDEENFQFSIMKGGMLSALKNVSKHLQKKPNIEIRPYIKENIEPIIANIYEIENSLKIQKRELIK